MAAEAQAEGPAPPPPPAPAACRASLEKRALSGDGGEKERRRPEPKRRRACVAALDSVPCAAAEEEVGGPGSGCDAGAASSFSFPHARGGFVALETTPKFGSFNPPRAAEGAALDLEPAQPDGGGEPDDEVPDPAASARGRGAEGQVKDEKSQLVGVEVDGQGQT